MEKIYQLLNEDGGELCLVQTDLPIEKVDKEFKKWYKEEIFYGDIDNFVDTLKDKGIKIERVFIEGFIQP